MRAMATFLYGISQQRDRSFLCAARNNGLRDLVIERKLKTSAIAAQFEFEVHFK